MHMVSAHQRKPTPDARISHDSMSEHRVDLIRIDEMVYEKEYIVHVSDRQRHSAAIQPSIYCINNWPTPNTLHTFIERISSIRTRRACCVNKTLHISVVRIIKCRFLPRVNINFRGVNDSLYISNRLFIDSMERRICFYDVDKNIFTQIELIAAGQMAQRNILRFEASREQFLIGLVWQFYRKNIVDHKCTKRFLNRYKQYVLPTLKAPLDVPTQKPHAKVNRSTARRISTHSHQQNHRTVSLRVRRAFSLFISCQNGNL